MLDVQKIKEIIPHRYPFLLVDKVTEMEEGKRVVGLKTFLLMNHFSKVIFQNTQSCLVC